jgi:hypothetical protein
MPDMLSKYASVMLARSAKMNGKAAKIDTITQLRGILRAELGRRASILG